MKSKKVTMLAAALVVAVVAFAAVGYATNYTATTKNDQNTFNSTYMVLTQTDGQAAYSKNIFSGILYNTENTGTNSTTYYPVAQYEIDTQAKEVVPGSVLAKVSKDLELILDTSKSTSSTYSMTVDVTAFTPIAGLIYTMILTDSNGKIVGNADITSASTDKDTWSFSTLSNVAASTANNKINVALYISSSAGVPNPTATNFDTAGFTNYVDAETPGSIFTFTVTATA